MTSMHFSDFSTTLYFTIAVGNVMASILYNKGRKKATATSVKFVALAAGHYLS